MFLDKSIGGSLSVLSLTLFLRVVHFWVYLLPWRPALYLEIGMNAEFWVFELWYSLCTDQHRLICSISSDVSHTGFENIL